MLAPLAAPGYVLRYDMVFVPRQPLSWELVAPGDALPRAVPLDALVSLATQVVPGWLLQRVVLAAVAAPRRGRRRPAGARPATAGCRVVAAVGVRLDAVPGRAAADRAVGAAAGVRRAALAGAAARDLRAGRPGRAAPGWCWPPLPAAVTPTGGLIALGTVRCCCSPRRGPAPDDRAGRWARCCC